jgi:hypothetical protein
LQVVLAAVGRSYMVKKRSYEENHTTKILTIFILMNLKKYYKKLVKEIILEAYNEQSHRENTRQLLTLLRKQLNFQANELYKAMEEEFHTSHVPATQAEKNKMFILTK